jgi:hypothetical protein
MGLLDWFRRSDAGGKDVAPAKAAREVARLSRLVESKFSQNYDRQDAIAQLGRLGTAASCTALLKRFNWSMDPSITDQEEKDSALQGLILAGNEALEPIRAYCRRADSLTWPLKALRQIAGEEGIEAELLGILDHFDTEYMRNPEPKVQLLNELSAFKGEAVRLAVQRFLEDVSEPVRFAAASALYTMDAEPSLPALLAALEHEESVRVQNKIAVGLAEKKWLIPIALQESCGSRLPRGYQLRDGLVVAA